MFIIAYVDILENGLKANSNTKQSVFDLKFLVKSSCIEYLKNHRFSHLTLFIVGSIYWMFNLYQVLC